MLLFPQPFGPTMAETPGGKPIPTLSTKDLNPKSSSFLSLIQCGLLSNDEVKLNQPLVSKVADDCKEKNTTEGGFYEMDYNI